MKNPSVIDLTHLYLERNFSTLITPDDSKLLNQMTSSSVQKLRLFILLYDQVLQTMSQDSWLIVSL